MCFFYLVVFVMWVIKHLDDYLVSGMLNKYVE